MTNTLISFHGDKKIKEKYLKRVKNHFAADEIIKGKYWEGGKGCAVGCTIHSDKHDNYETELGLSWRIALLQDSLFEKLPNGDAKKFPVEFLEKMPIGVDTNLIFKKFIIWNLGDKKEGLANIVKDEKVKILLKEICDTYKKSLTQEIENKVWVDLAKKSQDAYAYASASAYASPEWQQKFDERILRMRNKLFELMESAK